MPKLNLPELYRTQISQTEWLEAIGHDQAVQFRAEDNDKRKRLKRIHDLVGLPFDEPHSFPASDLEQMSPEFKAYLTAHSSELCALRVIPASPGLPKLRTRGGTVSEALEWFTKQHIKASDYRAEFTAHSDNQTWSTIFVVNHSGAFGEIIAGSHTQLTQGFYEEQPPMRFSWDFETIRMVPASAEAREHLRMLLGWLKIDDAAIRRTLARELDAQFTHGYLHGYFETTTSPEFGPWFVDYNRILGTLYEDFTDQPQEPGAALLSGQAGSKGVATGSVRIVMDAKTAEFKDGEVLVCPMTTPDFVPLMTRACAVVTDYGGVLSHAAIVARELHKPCLTATGNATTKLHTGMTVTVDADSGVVRPA